MLERYCRTHVMRSILITQIKLVLKKSNQLLKVLLCMRRQMKCHLKCNQKIQLNLFRECLRASKVQ